MIGRLWFNHRQKKCLCHFMHSQAGSLCHYAGLLRDWVMMDRIMSAR